ncbi:glycosyltransferase [Paenibacillus aquistagni]|uniref:glycosyltransferase n=1 Tax=Paenibacillus aquistagni TaxID=1852522 RepID=UPI00145ADB70|nr:glycosyltransferase [Paenibacillus aquistagni]NMM54266.1 glycosyltransferase [Paenibacillus aquistagni]
MGLSYIADKLSEIRLKRAEILKEMNLYPDFEIPEDTFYNGSLSFHREFDQLSEMKIACIMDEFTYNSFSPECQLLQITPQDWLVQMESLQPDLFFLESAWLGVGELWKTKVPHLSNELIEVLSYCKKKNIPIVFWNKEDPIHFETFLATAKYADYVFTTDIDCIKKYKTLLKHHRVYLMPFAAQLKNHNPIELYNRADKFCFAGAYYKRYPDRNRDLETFIEAITPTKGLDIYDRNFYKNDPNYAFPGSYKKYIVGNLKPEEIDKAYKGYRFNINMNSVKQSQSMCARRVFELLASNTVTVSNYSRAVRNLLGDLVVCTDDGKQLSDEISKFSDEEYYNKFRLLGLRKVLTEHTYTNRLSYIVNTVYENKLQTGPLRAVILARVKSKDEFEHINRQYQRQSYKETHMFIISEVEGLESGNESVEIIGELTEEIARQIQTKFDYAFFFSPKDYYGDHYVTDFMLATQYNDFPVLTKDVYFKNDEHVTKASSGKVYSTVTSYGLRRSSIRLADFSIENLYEYVRNIEDQSISSGRVFSIDEYNYCESYIGDDCPWVDDLKLSDQGISLEEIYHKVETIKPGVQSANSIHISPKELYEMIGKSNKVNLKTQSDGILAESKLRDSHEYMYLHKLYSIDDLGFDSKLDVYLDVDFISKFSVDIVVVTLDRNEKKIDSVVKPSSRKVQIKLAPNAKYIELGIRFAGEGSCKIKSILLGEIDLDNGCFISKSNVLLITDNYPDYENLYRYGFIHSRMSEYKNVGKVIDMFKFNNRVPNEYSEFNGIDVTSGYFEEFNNVVMNGGYDTLLIHFLNETIWNGLKNFLSNKRIIIWVHGSEIQPWWRRDYNYKTPQQLEKAKKESERRLQFWGEVFAAAAHEEYNIHFVFVSNYFTEEVFEDHKIRLPKDQYTIIHNYINTDLFSYVEKDVELRKRVLSIRPFASNKYANDLTVKAIQHLSKDPVFKHLEFTIIGKGALFQSTLNPIKKLKNVKIEERFLDQKEISMIHKKYGVFLVPTRMDSQGVSRDEAMSSGLVPITNNITAIPEFVDNECGILVEPEDYVGLGEGIKSLFYNPELYSRLSKAAADRVRIQSGKRATIEKELLMIFE